MSIISVPPDATIRGSCSFFVCRRCRTKYGWPHQPWCDSEQPTDPGCPDCAYYNSRRDRCSHPAKKQKRRDTV